jgi:hypothetical protein
MRIFNRVRAVHKRVTGFGARDCAALPEAAGGASVSACFLQEFPVCVRLSPDQPELCISREHRFWQGF